jgi:hypothetical protein
MPRTIRPKALKRTRMFVSLLRFIEPMTGAARLAPTGQY